MGRAPCCDKNGLKKGPWTPEEDQKLVDYIQLHGPGNWRNLPKNAGLQRCGKSCRLRWTNYLRPDIKRGRFSFEEEETIIQLHSILGNKWSAIAARLPGRTDNEIKNYWNTHIRKRLLRNGIDPVTHTPRLDLLDLSTILRSSSQILNFSNLLGTQALLNPDLLRLVSTLMSLKQENPDMLLQYLQQNQTTQPQNQIPELNQQFQTLNPNPNVEAGLLSSDNNMMANLNSYQNSLESLMPSNLTENLQENLSNAYTVPAPPETSSFQSLNNNTNTINNINGNYQNFGFDNYSVMSTPMGSPTPLNSSSFINGSSTEDERESYCSSLLQFEIPETLDINDFL